MLVLSFRPLTIVFEFAENEQLTNVSELLSTNLSGVKVQGGVWNELVF
jgi:hypothetical protein